MGRHEDKLFMKRFSMVIAALVVVTIVIIIIASTHDREADHDDYPSRFAAQAERVQPVGAVRTELATATSEMADVEDAGTEVVLEPESAVAGAAIDGSAVYAGACQACHISGAAGAPIPGSDAWAERAAKGADTLYANAINGINAMPAKGGRMDLSDAEVRAAVDHMLAQ